MKCPNMPVIYVNVMLVHFTPRPNKFSIFNVGNIKQRQSQTQSNIFQQQQTTQDCVWNEAQDVSRSTLCNNYITELLQINKNNVDKRGFFAVKQV